MNILSKSRFENLRLVDIATIIFFSSRAFTALFNVFFGQLGIYISMAVLFLVYLALIFKKYKEKDSAYVLVFIIIAAFITLLSLLTMISNPFIKDWILDKQHGLIVKTFDVRKAIFAIFIVFLIRDLEKLSRNLEISAYINLIYLVFQIILFHFSKSWINYYMVMDSSSIFSSYNMSLGYELVFVTLILLTIGYKKESTLNTVMGSFAFLLAFVYGSRGVVVPILAFYALVIIFNIKGKTRKKYVAQSILILLAFLLSFNLFMEYKIDTNLTVDNIEEDQVIPRNYEMIANSTFTSENGRITLYNLVFEAIKEKFPLGYGVYGERPFVGDRFKWGYSHNFVLELVVSFGIFGIIAIIFLVFLTLKFLLKEEYSPYKEIIIIFLALNSKLIISDSFWHLDYFWTLIGIYIIISTKNWDWNIKRLNVTLSLLLVLNVVFAGVFLIKDYKDYRYSLVRFEEPMIILTFDEDPSETNDLIEYLVDNEIKGTSFVDPLNLDGVLQENIVLGRGGLWDYQARVDLSLYEELGAEDIKAKIDDSFQASGLKQPQAMTSKYEDVGINDIFDLSKMGYAIRLKKRFGPYYHIKKLSNNDYYKIPSYDLMNTFGTSDDYTKTVQSIINNAERNSALLVMNINYDLLVKDDNFIEYSDYIKTLVGDLKGRGFKFISIGELMDLAIISEDDKNIKGYIGQYIGNYSILPRFKVELG